MPFEQQLLLASLGLQRLIDCLLGFVCSDGWLAGWLAGWPAGRPAGWLAGWRAGGWVGGHSIAASRCLVAETSCASCCHFMQVDPSSSSAGLKIYGFHSSESLRVKGVADPFACEACSTPDKNVWPWL